MEGRGAEAVDCVEKAMRLNPSGQYYWDLGQAQYAAGRYEAAAKTLRNAPDKRATDGAHLANAYYTRNIQVVYTQFQNGGVRLAKLLEDIYGGPQVAAEPSQ